MIELVLAMATSGVVLMAAAILILGGQQCWSRTYNRNNSTMQVETISATAAFTAFGRRANKNNYTLYNQVNNTFVKVTPQSLPDEVLFGNAVEFRYWEQELSGEIMNAAITATDYVMFYLHQNELRADYGPFPPGAVDTSGNRLTGDDVRTVTLVHNVTQLRFSHTAQNMAGDGLGCVKMELTAQDPATGEQKIVLAATLLRNVWP